MACNCFKLLITTAVVLLWTMGAASAQTEHFGTRLKLLYANKQHGTDHKDS